MTGLGTGSQKVTGGENLAGPTPSPAPAPSPQPQSSYAEAMQRFQESVDKFNQTLDQMQKGKKPSVYDKAKQHYQTVDGLVKAFEKDEQIIVQGGPNMGHLGSE